MRDRKREPGAEADLDLSGGEGRGDGNFVPERGRGGDEPRSGYKRSGRNGIRETERRRGPAGARRRKTTAEFGSNPSAYRVTLPRSLPLARVSPAVPLALSASLTARIAHPFARDMNEITETLNGSLRARPSNHVEIR